MNLGVKTGFCTRRAHFFPVLCSKNTKKFLLLQCTSKKKLKHMAKSTFLQDFKAFAVKGNAIDMAVGVIIGGVDFKDLTIKLPAVIEGQSEVTINYGNFIQTVLDFLIVAFCVFMLVRAIQSLKKKEAEPEAPAAPAAPTQEELLAEIRDLLKKQG